MKNKILFICFIFVFYSCNKSNNAKKDKEKNNNLENKIIDENDDSKVFLDLFKDVHAVGLHIYSPKWDSTGALIKTQFDGRKIDVNKFNYCDNKGIFINIQACKEGISNIYAIGKFKINDEFLGLITRQFSQYDESLIQLLLWSKKKKEISKGLDLADSFGDGGWYFDKESWIFKTTNLKIVSRKKEFEYDDNFKSKTYKDSLKTYEFNNGKFIESTSLLNDTINYKLKNWAD
ncbi:MAG: hypothetical protein PHS59_09310 [Paludibacter sp.]|nr:hypothetical protein [Paludibacter sp.]